ncbi:MAG TPA: PIN domain-containing protein [Candidatus Angelobacter sp.]|nr:PIN domain-containing protein [Candidatus Angelobacter sp.]
MNFDFPVIIDACVLVQPAVRDTILRLSECRLFLARWSDDIIAELDRTLIRFGVPKEKVEHLRSQMKEHFPDAWVEPSYKELVPAMKNDEKDRHVVAAGVRAGCELIVTYNLKHFKEEHLKPFDLTARHPDEFLIDTYHLNPEIVVHALHQQGTALRERRTLPQVLERLRAAKCNKFADLITERLAL